jgi:hypothetical protein
VWLLGDSNLDWGQDLPALAEWQKDHAGVQMYLCYFGLADPFQDGLHFVKADGGMGPAGELPRRDVPAVLAVSATALQGIYLTESQRAYYGQFLLEKPIGVAGGSIYIYDHLENRLPVAVLPSGAAGN